MIDIRPDYTSGHLASFEAVGGGPADFTLTDAWAVGAEDSGYGRSFRALALEGEKPIAIAQGILRRAKTLRKLSCGSNSGFGVAWQSGRDPAAVACLADLAKRARPSIVELFTPAPLELAGVAWENAYTFHVDLRKPPDSILSAMSREARREIRRAERLGVSARVVEDLPRVERAYDLIHKAAEIREFPIPPREYSLSLHREFAKLGRQGCAISVLDGEIVAAVALLGYGKKVAWWKGGSSPEGYKSSAGNLAQFAAMEWAKNCGFDVYDLGGTDPNRPAYAGIHKFKSSLGGALITTSLGCRWTATARLARRVAHSLK